MPANTIRVCRPGHFGNPFKVGRDGDAAECVKKFEEHLTPRMIDDAIYELRGKNLACWCKKGTPCHADVLLRVANQDL
jgi:hypothetical protein